MSVTNDHRDAIGAAYLERLTEADLRSLVRAEEAGSSDASARVAALRREPALVLDVLDRPSTSAAILNLAADRALTFVSPFLVFAAAVHRTAADLAATSYAPERTHPRQRVPVFDALQLAAYLAEPQHRLFLADLLASFARISSGVTITRTPHGRQRRRWNDMDPAALAVLLDSVPEHERGAVWRRLGDLALFLSGVFPDAAEQVVVDRLAALRLAQLTGLHPREVPDAHGPDLLAGLGAGWYRLAARAANGTRSGGLGRGSIGNAGLRNGSIGNGGLGGSAPGGPAGRPAPAPAPLAEEFYPARRVLSTVTDRYLLPVQTSWFVPPRG